MKLYIGDILDSNIYKYGEINSDYVDLYSVPSLNNGTYVYYRYYINNGLFSRRERTVSQYNYVTLENIDTTNDFAYSPSMPSALFCFVIMVVLLFKAVDFMTLIFKKGGVFSELV